MTIIKHEWKANLKTLLIWAGSVGSMVFLFMLMFPMLEDSLTEMGDVYSNMQGFAAAFGLDKLSIYTPMGYYGTEVGAVIALGGSLFGALLGSGMLSKEEGGHTAEFLLSAPISRVSVVIQKIIALTIIIAAYEVICIVLGILAFFLIDGNLELKELLLYHLAQYLMHLEIAYVCFCISAFMKKQNVGMGLGIALILYFIDMMGKIIPDLDFLKYTTPFAYADAALILTTGELDWKLILLGIVIAIIAIATGCINYRKKDITA